MRSVRAQLATIALGGAVLAAVLVWVLRRDAPDAEVASRGPANGAASVGESNAELERPNAEPEVVVAPYERRERATEAPPLDGFHVRGRLLEPDGARVSGREAGLTLRTADGIELYSKPRGDGAFELGPLDAGTYELVAREPDHASARTTLVLAGDYARIERDLVLAPWRRITVRVRDPDGAPFAPRVMSSREWGYRLPLTAVATSEVPGESGLDPNDTVAKGLGEYRGIGVNALDTEHEDGAPAWDRDAAPKDAIGEFRVRALPVFVALLLQGRRLAVVQVSPGQHEANFVVDPEVLRGLTTALRLRVLAGTTNAPLEHAWVYVAPKSAGNDEVWEGARTHVGSDGVFTAIGLEQGESEVVVGCERWPTIVVPVTLVPGAPIDLGDVVLPAARTLQGRVLDSDGNVVSMRLVLTPLEVGLGQKRARSVPSGPEGFDVGDLAPGIYSLRSFARSSSVSEPVRPAPGGGGPSRDWSDAEWGSSLAWHVPPVRFDLRTEHAVHVDVRAESAWRVEVDAAPIGAPKGSDRESESALEMNGLRGPSRGDTLVVSTLEGEELLRAQVPWDASKAFLWLAEGEYRARWEGKRSGEGRFRVERGGGRVEVR